MHRLIPLFLCIAFIAAGCSNQNLAKQEYYERGIEFLKGGNANGSIIAFKKAIELDQNFFEARYQLASAYILKRKYESAERELQKALRLNPSLHKAHLSLAKTYLNMGKNDEVIEEIDKYLSNKREDPEAFDLVASAYAAKKDYTRAEEFLNRSFALSPDRASSRLLRAMVYIKIGAISRAENLLNEILQDENVNQEALFLLAGIKRKKGEVAELITIYEKFLQNDPENIRARYELGLAYLQHNNSEETVKVAEALKRSQPNLPEGYFLTGLMYFQKRDFDQAIIDFKKASSIAAIPGAHYYLGLCHLSKGNLELATNEFQRAINLQPDMIQARLMLAVTHFRRGRLENAERETMGVLSTHGENAFAHNLLGSIYMASGDGERAMSEFDIAIELDPQLIDAHIKKGAFNLLSGNTKDAEVEFLSAVEIAPDILSSRIILAKYYLKYRRFKDAIAILQQGINGKENDAILYNGMGVAYLGLMDIEKASDNFEQAIKQSPGFSLPYHNLALIHLKNREKEKAVTIYRRLLDIENDNVPGLLMLAKIMGEEGKDKEAIAFYSRAASTRKPDAYISYAEYYFRKNDHKRAIEILDEALRFNPMNVKVMDLKGRIFAAKENYKSALEIYKSVSDLSPDVGAMRLAGIYGMMKDYDSAIRELKQYLARKNERLEIRAQIVNLLLQKKDKREAEQYAREIVSLYIDDFRAYQTLASVYYANGQYQKAIETLETADTLHPENLETTINIGKAYLANKDFHKALLVFEKVETLRPNYAPVYFLQANTLELLGEKRGAIQKYKKLLEITPDNVLALNNLAYLYAEGHGPLDQALSLAKKARVLAPEDGRVADTLGWALYKNGNYDDALDNFKEAIRYLPDEPSIRYHLGLAYFNQGINKEAKKAMESAVRIGSKNYFSEIEDARAILDRMR